MISGIAGACCVGAALLVGRWWGRRSVRLELEDRMVDLGRDRGGPDFDEDAVEQDNSSCWPEISSCDRRELALES